MHLGPFTNVCFRRKENVQTASLWGGQRLKQKATLKQAPAADLCIPVDDDLQAQPSPQHVTPLPMASALHFLCKELCCDE